MFQYTHELIFNSLTMPDGSKRLVRNGGDKGPLTIKRGGEYWMRFIQNQIVYKTPGHVGKYEILTLDVEKLGQIFPGRDGESFMVPGTYQLNMFVKLLDPHALYEFGYPNWNTFGRQLLIGFDVAPTDQAADVAKKIYESYELAVRKEEFAVGGEVEEEALVPYADGGTKVSLRANHYALRFDSMGISLYDETMCDSCLGEYLPVVNILNNAEEEKNAAEIAVEGVEPFATGEWLVENLRFPTYPNIRYYAVGAADRPVPGVTYVQYSFAYESPRPQLGGVSGVGQAMTAVTRHVYYVPEALAEEFEAGFTGIGCQIVETMPEVTDVDANTAFTPGGAPVKPQSGSESGNEGSDGPVVPQS